MCVHVCVCLWACLLMRILLLSLYGVLSFPMYGMYYKAKGQRSFHAPCRSQFERDCQSYRSSTGSIQSRLASVLEVPKTLRGCAVLPKYKDAWKAHTYIFIYIHTNRFMIMVVCTYLNKTVIPISKGFVTITHGLLDRRNVVDPCVEYVQDGANRVDILGYLHRIYNTQYIIIACLRDNHVGRRFLALYTLVEMLDEEE